MIDIDTSAEANAIENLLDEAISSIPTVALHLLASFPVTAVRGDPHGHAGSAQWLLAADRMRNDVAVDMLPGWFGQ